MIYTYIFISIVAVHRPLRTKTDTDQIRVQNNNTLTRKFSDEIDNIDTISDDFDSDSKENENVSLDLLKN